MIKNAEDRNKGGRNLTVTEETGGFMAGGVKVWWREEAGGGAVIRGMNCPSFVTVDRCLHIFTSLSVSTGGGEGTTIPNCFWCQQVARRSSTPPTQGNTCFTFYFNMCLLDACASSLHIVHQQIKITMIDWEPLNGPRNDWLLFVSMPSNLTIIRGVLTAYLLGLIQEF